MSEEQRHLSDSDVRVALAVHDKQFKVLESWLERLEKKLEHSAEKIAEDSKNDRHELANRMQVGLDALRNQIKEASDKDTNEHAIFRASIEDVHSRINGLVNDDLAQARSSQNTRAETRMNRFAQDVAQLALRALVNGIAFFLAVLSAMKATGQFN